MLSVDGSFFSINKSLGTESYYPSFDIFCSYVSVIRVKAPSPVTLQAVPKLSCNAKMVSNRAVPASSNCNTEMMRPSEARTVPPGTPGAPIANNPSNRMNKAKVKKFGILPYNNCDTVITKTVSVKMEPQRWMFANKGTVTSLISLRRIGLLCAQSNATPRVAADDMVPNAVR